MSTAVEDRKIKNETFRGDNEKLVLSCSETIAKGETATSVRYDIKYSLLLGYLQTD